MRVKSGPVATATAGAACCADSAGAGAGLATVSARDSDAVRIRPVTTRPATKPAAIRMIGKSRPRSPRVMSTDVDSARPPLVRFRNGDRQHAVLQVGGDGVDVNRLRQREGAREAA